MTSIAVLRSSNASISSLLCTFLQKPNHLLSPGHRCSNGQGQSKIGNSPNVAGPINDSLLNPSPHEKPLIVGPWTADDTRRLAQHAFDAAPPDRGQLPIFVDPDRIREVVLVIGILELLRSDLFGQTGQDGLDLFSAFGDRLGRDQSAVECEDGPVGDRVGVRSGLENLFTQGYFFFKSNMRGMESSSSFTDRESKTGLTGFRWYDPIVEFPFQKRVDLLFRLDDKSAKSVRKP